MNAPIAYEQIDAINWSTLKLLHVSPKLLRWRVDHPEPETRKERDALRIGTAIHCAVLEPERFARSYVVRPDFGDLRRKTAKAAKAAWESGLEPGAEIIKHDEHETVTHCAESIDAHQAASRIMRGCRREEIVTWTDEETGLACKGRLDLIAPMYIADLKSTRHETLRQIESAYASLLYHGQLAYYHDGAIAARALPRDGWDGPFSIAVQTVEPYDVVAYRLSLEDLDRGRRLYRSLLRRYLECKAAGWWPGIGPELMELHLPPWAPSGDAAGESDW